MMTRFLLFHHYPDMYVKAAEAALCAAAQGKFWQMYEMLFVNQRALGLADLKRYGSALGLRVPAFGVCLDRNACSEQVQKDRVLGQSLGVAATPATFINGRLVPGAVSTEEFVAVIEEELSLEGGKTFSGNTRPVGSPGLGERP